MTLTERIDAGAPLEELAELLDGLDSSRRIEEVLGLGRARQRRLFEAAGAGPKASLEALVPRGSAGETVFRGRNSMPLFSRFEKRLFRSPDGGLWGYNRQSMSWLTGPGYFSVSAEGRDGSEILFDYTKVPDRGPDGAPPPAPNEGLAAGPAFGGMTDYVRRVSDDCLIGWAFKGGKDLGVTFLLVR